MSAEYNRDVQPASPAAAARAAARPAWARWLLGAILTAAFLLRVVGVTYGLPEWVYHSDTPKQLVRIVPFMRGHLVPADTYPVLHMYLAALLLRVGALVDPHGLAGPSWLQVVERDGKLLRRFELLPRGFTAPTIAYYDLESMTVPYAFPPPDAAASDEAVVFVDPDLVPDRAAVVVTPGQPRTWTLVSRTPLPRITLALTGEGRLHVRSRLRSRGWPVDPRRPTLVELSPWREFPWFKSVYRLRLEAAEGRVVVRLLDTPCEVAEQRLALEDWAGGISLLESCRGARWMEPARLLDLAWARARAGQPDRGRAALAELERVAPGLFAGLVDLAARPDGEAWRARYATLVGRGRFSWHGHTFRGEAETTPAPLGVAVEDGTASGGRFLRVAAGTPPGLLKVWLPGHFLRGRFLAAFRVRGTRAGPGPGATFEVIRHLPGRGYDLVAVRDWMPGPGAEAWEDVIVPFATDLEPVDIELRARYHGRGTLDVDRMTVMPDVRAGLAERLAVLRPLAPPPG